MGVLDYIVWSFVLLQFRGHKPAPVFTDYVVSYRTVRHTLPSEKVLRKIPPNERRELAKSFQDHNRETNGPIDLAHLDIPAGAVARAWEELPESQRGRLYLKVSAPGVSKNQQHVVLYVEWWADQRRQAGEWWLLESHKNKRTQQVEWRIRTRDRKMIGAFS